MKDRLLFSVFLALVSGPIHVSADVSVSPRGVSAGVSTPTARMFSDGDVALSYGRDASTKTLSIAFQALPKLTTSLSFTTYDLANNVGSAEIASANIKYQLLGERENWPALAIGFDGLFSNSRDASEYIVASKRFGQGLDLSFGVGWGQLAGVQAAGRGGLDRDRLIDTRHLFDGRSAAFGSLSWVTPVDGLTAVMEYGSDAQDQTSDVDGRLSFGVRYAVADGVDVLAYSDRGQSAGFLLSFSGNPSKPRFPPDLVKGPPLVFDSPAPVADIAKALREDAVENGFRILEIAQDEDVIEVVVSGFDASPIPRMIGRAARLLTRHTPASVKRFKITAHENGLATKTVVIPRRAIIQFVNQPNGALRIWDAATIQAARPLENPIWQAAEPTGFSWSIRPAVVLDLTADEKFDPTALIYARGAYRFSRAASISGRLSYQVAGDRASVSPPAEPRARADSRAYDRKSIRLDQLAANYVTPVAPALYGRLSFGLLERQYGGISGEVLWTPAQKNWAIGVDVSYVRKRDYDDPLGFLDFDAVTGHGSLYWDTGYRGLSAQIDVGRYLAGDWGTSLTLSRYFTNGWNVSAFTTVTEANSDEKLKVGANVTIPLNWLAPTNDRRASNLRLGGVAGEFGAKLSVPDRLYPKVRRSGYQRLDDGWGDFWK